MKQNSRSGDLSYCDDEWWYLIQFPHLTQNTKNKYTTEEKALQ